MVKQDFMVIIMEKRFGKRRDRILLENWVEKNQPDHQNLMTKLQRKEKCKSYMVIQDMLQLEKLLKHQKLMVDQTEKIEPLINYNLTFSPMRMKT